MKNLVVVVIVMFVVVVMCTWFILYDNYVTDALVQEYDNAGNVQTLNCTAVAKTDSTVTLQDEQGWLWQVEDDTITVENVCSTVGKEDNIAVEKETE